MTRVKAAGRCLTVAELREALADADPRDEVVIESQAGEQWRPLVVDATPGIVLLDAGEVEAGLCAECGDEYGGE